MVGLVNHFQLGVERSINGALGVGIRVVKNCDRKKDEFIWVVGGRGKGDNNNSEGINIMHCC